MEKRSFVILFVATAVGLVHSPPAFAQTTTRTEVGNDGTSRQITEWQVTQPYTDYETRSQRVYQPKQTAQMQTFQQTYAVPVTEYRMVTRLRGWWNPLTPSYYTHEMVPTTRWDYRTANVQMPASRTEWVEGTQSVQVPVTKYRTEKKQLITSILPGSTNIPSTLGPQQTVPVVASRPIDGNYGSQRMTSDIPREPSHLGSESPGSGYRR